MATRELVDLNDYSSRLTKAKGKDKYICPVCGGNDLSVSSKNGIIFTCYTNDCSRAEIIKAIAPEKYGKKDPDYTPTKARRSISKPTKPAPLPESGTLATLPKIPLKSLRKQVPGGYLTTYQYSETHWVERTDYDDGRKKLFIPHHTDSNGNTIPKKGDDSWPAYKEGEAIAYGQGKWVLWVEGEKCTDAVRSLGFVGITFTGGAKATEQESALIRLKNAGIAGIAIIPDNDDAGTKKLNDVTGYCHKWQIPLVNLGKFLDIPEGEDIADLVEDYMDNQESIVQHLNAAMVVSLASAKEEALKKDPDFLFKMDLQALAAETDFIKYIRFKNEICANWRIRSQDLDKAINHLNHSQNTPKVQSMDFAEFMEMEVQGLQWLIPGFLPVGETILLSGAPKAGKSLLAVDCGFCLATGEDPFLGEKLHDQKRVLLISVDESPSSTKTKLQRRGFRSQDAPFLRVMTSWDISQMVALEKELEDFRPHVVIVDSLKRITAGRDISENSAEFADNIYTLKELFTRYGAAGILIHHDNKDKDAVGVDKVRGSSAIAGAVWGMWNIRQVPKPDPDNPKRLVIDPRDPERTLYCHSRDTEGQLLRIQFNPDDNSYECLGEVDTNEEKAEADRTMKDRILMLLERHPDQPLSGTQILELMGEKDNKGGIYTNLSRLVNKRIVSATPAPNNKRYTLYSLPQNVGDTPPPTLAVGNVISGAESKTEKDLQTYNTHITSTPRIDNNLTPITPPVMSQNPNGVKVSGIDNNSPTEGGGVGVSDGVGKTPVCVKSATNTPKPNFPFNGVKMPKEWLIQAFNWVSEAYEACDVNFFESPTPEEHEASIAINTWQLLMKVDCYWDIDREGKKWLDALWEQSLLWFHSAGQFTTPEVCRWYIERFLDDKEVMERLHDAGLLEAPTKSINGKQKEKLKLWYRSLKNLKLPKLSSKEPPRPPLPKKGDSVPYMQPTELVRWWQWLVFTYSGSHADDSKLPSTYGEAFQACCALLNRLESQLKNSEDWIFICRVFNPALN
ncbi:AAA family ATPase [Laspinema olomoucense]|uniref:AAA family ATPase n=1 Tax=Laspinema olomoucense D3b TaxID=2953688 RepID=A0ABT2NFS3_9CYAN|nr:AAA family ATPase [Laspinema sp. D3b]MCT7981544.1 AAA family ATPase [Laspinema sp. D3b]